MRRLVPRSLGGQLAALLVGALLVAHLASLLVFSGERDRAVAAAVRFGIVDRVAALVEVIEEASPSAADRIVHALSTRRTRLTIDRASALPEDGMSDVEVAVADRLAGQVPAATGGPRVRLVERHGRGERRGWRHRRALEAVTVSVPLSGGRWLNATTAVRAPPIGWSWPWLVTLAASAVATLLVVALLVRRITGPMRALAGAAQKIGRGEAVEPVPARGPAEIRTTVDAFNAMQERLSRFVADRTRMVAAISHDLRTPITSLRLRTEFVADEELKAEMVRTLDEMQAMADATLAFAREDGTTEDTRSVDLAALIEGIVEDHAALGHAVTYDGPERLVWRCRPLSLKRALGNLVENAARYAGPAQVMLAERDGEAVVTVEDRGPGIPEERLAEVFEPFVRIETSRSRETGGVGLGLSIARTILRGHGGDLTLANRPEGGLAARATLP